MYCLLKKDQITPEYNRIFNCENYSEVVKLWNITSGYETFCKERLNTIKYCNTTKFEHYCLLNIGSFNMAKKMFDLGFNFSWPHYTNGESNIIDGKYYKHNNMFHDIRIELYEYNNLYGNVEFTFDLSRLHSINICDNYNSQTDHIHYFTTSLQQFLSWLIIKEKIVIIDKGDYIMFYKPDGDKVHLQRNEDNDIEWRDFNKVINRIFEII